MSVDDNIRAKILLNHHKDSFYYLRKYIKQRDVLFLLILIVISFMFLDFTNKGTLSLIVSGLVKKSVGEKVDINFYYIKSIIWFLLSGLIIKYYQIDLLVERMYNYFEKIEDMMSSLVQLSIKRESEDYLKNYPILLDVIYFLYKLFFPISLCVFVVYEISHEVVKYPMPYSAIDFIIAIILLISIILYLIYKHKNLVIKTTTKIRKNIDALKKCNQKL